MWSADFCDFRAQIPYGSCPYAPDRSWAVFWVHFGLCLELHAAHHESMWILGGEASCKLKGVNLHGELVRGVIGECGFKANGALSIV